MVELYCEMPCTLGEGPLWSGDRLFWFDIAAKRLYAARPGTAPEVWSFDGQFSAAARLADGLLLASETGLWRFDPATGARDRIVPLEAENRATRSNDGRADRQGGFWIGTMGKAAEPGAGALYRWHRGTLRRLRAGISIPNAICFAPDGTRAYFADTPLRRIFTWPLDADGWPRGEPALFLDLAGNPDHPDGAVVDSEGALWCALWGGGRVIRILPDARVAGEIRLPVSQPSCPAFGADPARLYVTTARQGLSVEALSREPLAGSVFAAPLAVPGLPEPLVELGP